jgi:hypothetical protein
MAFFSNYGTKTNEGTQFCTNCRIKFERITAENGQAVELG